jgi:hypothetical protein
MNWAAKNIPETPSPQSVQCRRRIENVGIETPNGIEHHVRDGRAMQHHRCGSREAR